MVEPGRWPRIASSLIPIAGVAAFLQLVGPGSVVGPVLVAALIMVPLSAVLIPTRSGTVSSAVMAVAAALPFITTDGVRVFTLQESLAVIALGTAATWILRTARGDTTASVIIRSLRLAASGMAFVSLFELIGPAYIERLGGSESQWIENWWQIVTLFVVVPASFVVASVVTWVTGNGNGRNQPLEFRDLDVYVTVMTIGALFGLTFDVARWFAFVIAALPFLFAAGAFRRLAEAKRTYNQTVRALAQIPEAAGHVHPGHALRVAALATSLAETMGLDHRSVEDVEWSAYLHDIGRISLNDPGVARIGYTDADIAEWGSVIAEEATLSTVAQIIRRQHEPYRRPGQQPDPDLPIASRIIKVASAYDELTAEQGHSPLEGLEQLHRGSVYDYDPEIVNALRALLERRNALGTSA